MATWSRQARFLIGGYAWYAYKRREYANDLSDPNTLIAVDRGLNRQKGADDFVALMSRYHFAG